MGLFDRQPTDWVAQVAQWQEDDAWANGSWQRQAVEVIRSTGCDDIQGVIGDMSDSEIIEAIEEGSHGISQIVSTIHNGTLHGYQAAASAPNANDFLGWLLANKL